MLKPPALEKIAERQIMVEPTEKAHRYARMRVLAYFAALAAVLNGAVFWARRVGLMQPDTYWHEYQSRHFAALRQPGEMGPYLELLRFGSTLHDVEPWVWLITKGVKELVWLVVLLLLFLHLREVRLPRVMALHYIGFFTLTATSALMAVLSGLWLALFAGARATASWVLGAAAAHLADAQACRHFARAFVWVLALQAVLIPFEVWHGLTIYFMYVGDYTFARPVGTFNVPASLGAFAVVTWAMAMCWGQYGLRGKFVICAGTAAILVANASATAWVACFAAIVGTAYLRMRKAHRVALLLVAAPLFLTMWFALPKITGRADLHDSLWGRIQPVEVYAKRELSVTEAAFGHRFGAGTNAYASLSDAQTHATTAGDHPVGDSLPAALFWQVGVVGTSLIYSLMLIAVWRSPGSRLVAFAILASSATINVTEHFPLNLALGMWLANSARPVNGLLSETSKH
jgi:hypothetical protein